MATKRGMDKSVGELAAATCTLISRFISEVIGRGPRSVTATLRGVTLVVLLEGVLTAAEERLVALPDERKSGCSMVRQMRDQIMRGACPKLIDELAGALGRTAAGMFHDTAPELDQEVFVFSLAREKRQPKLS